jgi:hypothetical protein
MRRPALHLGLWTAMVLAGLLVACDGRDRTPSAPSPSPPPAPATPVMTGLEVSGPGSVPPGGTAQFTATARQSDGSTRDVTGQATWRTNRSSVLTVASTGVATARDRGDATLTAQFQTFSSTREVIVVPDGTYRLSGAVHEAGVEVRGARVEVRAGPSTGLSTLTGGGGRYALYGVAGDTEIRVTRDGYREHVQRITVADHQTIDVELIPVRPRRHIEGTYTLTVTADDSCRQALPQELRVRAYPAALTQNGPLLQATLSGADFLVRNSRGNRFNGGLDVSSANATFSILFSDYFYYYYYFYGFNADVIERVASSRYLVIHGSATGSVFDDRIAGLLNGSIEVIESTDLIRYRIVAACRSREHEFVLTR